MRGLATSRVRVSPRATEAICDGVYNSVERLAVQALQVKTKHSFYNYYTKKFGFVTMDWPRSRMGTARRRRAPARVLVLD
jgi:hypothetical protein